MRTACLPHLAEDFWAAQAGVTRPAPVDASAGIVVRHAVPYALRLEPLTNQALTYPRQPRVSRECVHRHQIFVEESYEVDFIRIAEVLHHLDDVFCAVIPDVPRIVPRSIEDGVDLALLVPHVLHVAGDPKVEAELAHEGATVRCVDVEASPAQHPLL